MRVDFNLSKLATAAFFSREGEAEYDKAREAFDNIYTGLFNDLMSGNINAFSMFTRGDEVNGNQRIFTRSTKQPGYIQVSYMWYKDGEILPVMDSQVNTVSKMLEHAPDRVEIDIC